jgi:O-antigen/teichoic acid export membrane protein
VGCSYVLYAWTVVMDTSMYVTKRTDLKPIALISSCVVILPIYYFLIRHWGMMGAAWATLVGFSVFAAVDYVMAQRVYRVRYQFGRMLKVLAIGAVALLASIWSTRISAGDLTIRLALMLAFTVAIWTLVMHEEERAFVKQEMAAIRTRILG